MRGCYDFEHIVYNNMTIERFYDEQKKPKSLLLNHFVDNR